ncbi:MAG: TolC family protein, partial [Methanococcaceae archaeon]
LVFVSFSELLQAQRILSLEESLSIALKESYSINSANFNLNSSEMRLEAAKLGLRTSVDMEVDVPNYSKNLVSRFNTVTQREEFYESGNTTYESRLSINQPIVFTNGQFSVIGRLFGRNQYSALNPGAKDYFSNLILNLNQPLFTFNTQKANLKRAELNLDVTKKNYSKTQADIIYNVTSGFFDLYRAKKSLEIAHEKVKQTELSYETAGNKFKAGLIAEVEALQLEVDLSASKDEELNALRRFNESKNDFKLLIGLDLNENIDVTAQLEYSPIEVDKESAIEYALKNRPEIFSSETDIELNEMNVDETSAKKNIKAVLNVNYGINKVDTSFSNVFNNFLQNRSVVLTFSLPIWDWGKNNREVESAEANLRLSKLNLDYQRLSIINEITRLVSRLESARERVTVLSKSVELAEKSYNISLERFKAGNITSFDLSQMQLRLTDAKTNSLNALIDYKLALADLNRRTLHSY